MVDELRQLQAMGLELPSPAYLFGLVVFGLIGFAAFRVGRKTGRRLTMWLGVALMLYPYAVSSTWVLYAIGVALCAAIAGDLRAHRPPS